MARPVTVVLGPGSKLFLTGYHHLATGLLQVYNLSTTQQAEVLPPTLRCLMDLVAKDAALNLGLPGWNHGLIATKEVVLDADGCEE